jgi:TonB-dependent receptor
VTEVQGARPAKPRATTSFYSLLLRTASLLVLSAVAFAAPAYAQTSATEATTPEEEEIVVTGIRASLQSSQEIKRNSTEIVDAITAVDIGALPDRSVTEALQRVSGVTIGRTNELRDIDRLSAEGSGVIIRGMTQVRGELNGRDTFSAKQGRILNFEDVPPEMVAAVNVFKNPSADHVEGGLGGIVDLRTRMPFDSTGQVIAFSFDESYGDLAEEWTPTGSVLYSNRWDTPIGEIGLLVDLAYSELTTRTDTIGVSPYHARVVGIASTNPIAGQPLDTVFVPEAIQWRTLTWERVREGYAAALQWRPSDDLEFYAQYLRSDAQQDSLEYAAWSNAGGFNVFPAPGTSFEFDDTGTFVSGQLVSSAGGSFYPFGVDTRFAQRHSVTSDYSIGMKANLSEQWTFSADVQFVKATTNSLDFTVFDNIETPVLEIDLSGELPQVNIGPADYVANRFNYVWAAAMDHHDDNDADEFAFRADLEYDFDSDWLKSLRFGGRFAERTATNRESPWNWGFISAFWDGSPNPDFPDQTAPARMDTVLPDQSTFYEFPNFFRGDADLPTQLWFPTESLVRLGPNAAYEILHPIETENWGWAPFSGVYDATNGFINTQEERTFAGYAVAFFGSEDAFGSGLKYDGNVGVRVVQTNVVGAGFARTNAFTGGIAPTFPADDLLFVSGGQVNPIEREHEYTDVLPSLNLRLYLTDDMQLRFAASQAISRPDFNQLEPYVTISGQLGLGTPGSCIEGVPSGGAAECVARYTGISGNPELDPMRATQFDLSYEWYFANAGSFYIAGFYKDIENWISTSTDSVAFTFNGVTRDVQLTTPVNLEEGTIRGFEIGYQQFFDFLPMPLDGFGVLANYTFVDSDGGANVCQDPYDPTACSNAQLVGLPLEGLSRNAYNVALMYEKYGVSARLAYNWRERYLTSASAANLNIPAFFDDYGQLDGSVFYSITDNLKIGLQGTNITNTRAKILMDWPTVYDHNWIVTDRRFALVLRGSW